MKYFYKKEKIAKMVGSLAYDDEDIKKFMGGNPFIDYPQLNHDNTIISEQYIEYPTWDGNELRNMTREEICEYYDLSILTDGEVYENGKITKIDPPSDFFKPVWSYPNWYEGATQEEISVHYFSLIDKYKHQAMSDGCYYIDSSSMRHRQKTRPEKDISLLCSVIYKLETKRKLGEENPVEQWAFEDGDIKNINLDEALMINLKCGEYVSAIYKAESILKSKTPNIKINFDEFIELVNSLSETKSYYTPKIEEKTSINTFQKW